MWATWCPVMTSAGPSVVWICGAPGAGKSMAARALVELLTGDGLRATAAIAAETTRRVLAGAAPGAWTPGRLFGPALVTDATGATVTVNGRPA